MLPPELWVQCFEFLHPSDIANVAKSCKQFKQIGYDNSLWKNLYLSEFGCKKQGDDPNSTACCDTTDWKTKYRNRRDLYKNALIENQNQDWDKLVAWLVKECQTNKQAIKPIVKVLKQHNKLVSNKKLVGNIISNQELITLGLLDQFMKEFDFEKVDIDDSFRLFMQCVVLPPSSKKLQIICNSFSQRFHDCTEHNPKALKFKSSDAISAVVYSMLMLNTDLHNYTIKNKITVTDFTKGMKGVNGGEDLPKEYIAMLYKKIQKYPILDARSYS